MYFKKHLSGKIHIELEIANVKLHLKLNFVKIEFQKQGNFARYFGKMSVLLYTSKRKDILP